MNAEQDSSPADVPVRPAATVMLLRDHAQGLQVYVQRRVRQMVFGADATVFPGGGVDAADAQPLSWAGRSLTWWAQRFGVEEPLVASVLSAAVREIFEETGVLLAGTPGHVGEEELETQRLAILDGVPIANALDALQATIRCDGLYPWARWITPPGWNRRYDTFFFVCALPEGASPRMLTTEAVEGWWITPGQALDGADNGSLLLMPPTEYQFRELARFARVDEVLEHAENREIETVRFDTPTR